MNDFINKKMRSPGNTDNRRFDRNRRSYGNPQYKGNDRSTNRDRKKGHQKTQDFDRLKVVLQEIFPDMHAFVSETNDFHNRMAQACERQAEAEERQAQALEKIAAHLDRLRVEGSAASTDNTDDATTSSSPSALSQSDNNSNAVQEPSDKIEVVEVIRNLRTQGATFGEIAAHLREQDVPTFSGKGTWHAQTIHRICKTNDMT